MAPRPCLDCGIPAMGTRCRPCTAQRERVKWQRNPNQDAAYRKLREQVAASLPVACWICRLPITHQGHDGQALTLDHIIPVSRGGSNGALNVRPAHKSCNSSRGADVVA